MADFTCVATRYDEEQIRVDRSQVTQLWDSSDAISWLLDFVIITKRYLYPGLWASTVVPVQLAVPHRGWTLISTLLHLRLWCYLGCYLIVKVCGSRRLRPYRLRLTIAIGVCASFRPDTLGEHRLIIAVLRWSQLNSHYLFGFNMTAIPTRAALIQYLTFLMHIMSAQLLEATLRHLNCNTILEGREMSLLNLIILT